MQLINEPDLLYKHNFAVAFKFKIFKYQTTVYNS